MNLFYTNPRSLQVARQAISRLLLVMLGSSTSAKTSDGSITSHVNKSAASHARRSSVKAGAANSTPKTRAITQAACTEGRGKAGDDKRVVALAGSTAQHAAFFATHARCTSQRFDAHFGNPTRYAATLSSHARVKRARCSFGCMTQKNPATRMQKKTYRYGGYGGNWRGARLFCF